MLRSCRRGSSRAVREDPPCLAPDVSGKNDLSMSLKGSIGGIGLLSLSRLKTKDETTGLILLGGYLSELGNSALVIISAVDQNCS